MSDEPAEIGSVSPTVLYAFPPALPVPGTYPRDDPDPDRQRSLLHDWLGAHRWAGSAWPDLLGRLAAAGRADIASARLFEGHVDALRILAQAGIRPTDRALYGVWASRSQRTGVSAVPAADGGLVLDGEIRFASGAGVIDRALVPVWLDADHHLLVDLAVTDLPVDTSAWATTAMAASRSHTVTVAGHRVGRDAVVGPRDFYLSRPGFFPGGVGVAACWAGGAVRIADLVRARITGSVADALAVRLGRIRLATAGAGAALAAAGLVLDADPTVAPGKTTAADPDRGRHHLIATETRTLVADAVHDVLESARRVAGPAGLAYDRELTTAIDDLQLYVLQHNRDADLGGLGRID